MTTRPFRLIPFETGSLVPGLSLQGSMRRSPNCLTVHFEISGPLTQLVLPRPAETPERRSGLWEKTCLEFFLATEGDTGYWEFNLSPAGHWNAYRFDDYRQGMREERAIVALPMAITRSRKRLSLSAVVDPGRLLPADRRWEASVSAVVAAADGSTAFWAIAHPGSTPDFHRRDGFVLRLAACG